MPHPVAHEGNPSKNNITISGGSVLSIAQLTIQVPQATRSLPPPSYRINCEETDTGALGCQWNSASTPLLNDHSVILWVEGGEGPYEWSTDEGFLFEGLGGFSLQEGKKRIGNFQTVVWAPCITKDASENNQCDFITGNLELLTEGFFGNNVKLCPDTNWTCRIHEVNTDTFLRLSNELRINSTWTTTGQAAGFAHHNTSLSGEQQFSELKFRSTLFNGGRQDRGGGPAVRIDVDGNEDNATFYAAMYVPTGGIITLRRYSGETTLGSGGTILAQTSRILVANDKLKLSAIGETLFVRVNDTTVIGPIRDTIIKSGRPGVATFATSQLGLSTGNLLTWDDFRAGTIRAANVTVRDSKDNVASEVITDLQSEF